jgi:2,4-dienoyl-CoA reductase-like NADH-dependent reductase (Old Yellow Enzyme family)
MALMTRSFSPGGVPTAEVAAYHRRRAENGVGLIITEGTEVGRPAALNEPDVPHFHGEAALAAWKKVVGWRAHRAAAVARGTEALKSRT